MVSWVVEALVSSVYGLSQSTLQRNQLLLELVARRCGLSNLGRHK
jgi:hypothetical protein